MRRRSALLASVVAAASHAAAAQTAGTTEARMARALAALYPAAIVKGSTATYPSLAEEMKQYNFPAFSIAVADSGRIVWAKGFGVKTAGTNDSVTPTTLFQAASIGKPITATATLRLVDQGKVSLDENVNTYLRSWKVPDNQFTTTEKVTLRRIMSHSAGLTVSGFRGYSPGAPLPTVPQILDGQPPANTPPVRVDVVPGSLRRYSGGGVTVEQLLLTEVVGKSFPVLMHELVFVPIGMTHSTFEQELPAALESQTASAHMPDGSLAPLRHKVYPEMAAAGLWSTPTDLLKWAVEITAARSGKSNKVLSREIATQMLTPQNDDNGLGPAVSGTGRGFNFGHGGLNTPGFMSNVIYYPETGQGAVIMSNGGRGGAQVPSEILRAIAKEFNWPGNQPQLIEAITIDTVALDRYAAKFTMNSDSVKLSRQGSRLFFTSTSGRTDEVALVARDRFIILWSGQEGLITFDAMNRAAELQVFGMLLERKQ